MATQVAQVREPSLDGIRGIAIALVLIGHLVPYGSSFSKPGVTVFFGLSGYLITRLLITELLTAGTVTLKNFFIRRFFRLLPASLVVVSSVWIWCLIWKVHLDSLVPDTLMVLLYVSNWGIADSVFTPPFLHMWSLSVEEQFYFLWPIAVAFIGARRRRLLVTLGIAILVSFAIAVLMASQGSPEITYRSETAAMHLLIGCMGALLESTGRMRWATKVGVAPLLIAIAAVPFCYVVLNVAMPWVDATVEPAISMGAVVAAIGARTSRLLRSQLLVRMGLLSYSLYLWQTPVTFNGVVHLSAAIQLPIIVLLAWATWRYIETPLRRIGRDLASRDRSAALESENGGKGESTVAP